MHRLPGRSKPGTVPLSIGQGKPTGGVGTAEPTLHRLVTHFPATAPIPFQTRGLTARQPQQITAPQVHTDALGRGPHPRRSGPGHPALGTRVQIRHTAIDHPAISGKPTARAIGTGQPSPTICRRAVSRLRSAQASSMRCASSLKASMTYGMPETLVACSVRATRSVRDTVSKRKLRAPAMNWVRPVRSLSMKV